MEILWTTLFMAWCALWCVVMPAWLAYWTFREWLKEVRAARKQRAITEDQAAKWVKHVYATKENNT